MATPNYKEQSAAYHGIEGAKYAARADAQTPGTTPVSFAFSKSISFDPAMEQQAVHYNNKKIMNIISDQGYTGAIGTSAQDRGFETALGHTIEVDGATADVNLNSLKRFDFYYEYKEKTASGIGFVVKVWVLNCETTKAAKAHNTDTNTITVGEYSYPITVYGDKIKAATGTENYRDENGNEITATRVLCFPSDTGYKEFDKAVPTVKMPTPEEP